jgi:Zn-dependent peptidase ImmA (M78 family)
MPYPPIVTLHYPDFRIIHNEHRQHYSPCFAALLRRITILHEEFISIANENSASPIPCVGSAMKNFPPTATDADIVTIVHDIRKTLGITFKQQIHNKGAIRILGFLRDKIQDVGIYVLIEGNLGSHHTNISPEEFRGIALTHPVVPFIIINANDSHPAKNFTLIHELAHIWFGKEGISNITDSHYPSLNSDTERLCDRVAAEFLMPRSYFFDNFPDCSNKNFEYLYKFIDENANSFGVSHTAFARRLNDLDFISHITYSNLADAYSAHPIYAHDKNRKSGGSTTSISTRFRLGRKVLETVRNAINDEQMGLVDAARTLNISLSRLKAILK